MAALMLTVTNFKPQYLSYFLINFDEICDEMLVLYSRYIFKTKYI